MSEYRELEFKSILPISFLYYVDKSDYSLKRILIEIKRHYYYIELSKNKRKCYIFNISIGSKNHNLNQGELKRLIREFLGKEIEFQNPFKIERVIINILNF